MNSLRKLIPLVATAFLAVTGTASADSPWTGSGTSTPTISDASSADPKLEYASPEHNGAWTFSATATAARRARLDYKFTGYHAWYQVTVGLELFVKRGETEVSTQNLVNAGPVNCCAAPSGGFSYSGSRIVDLQPGDVYGFRIAGGNYDSAPELKGTLSVHDADTTPPLVTLSVKRPDGPVKPGGTPQPTIVDWTVQDAESGIYSGRGCSDARLETEQTTTFTCEVSSNGGTTTRSITVTHDQTPPQIILNGSLTGTAQRSMWGGKTSAPIYFSVYASDRLDPRPSVSCDRRSGDQFAVGTTKLTCIARDFSGNESVKVYDVWVS